VNAGGGRNLTQGVVFWWVKRAARLTDNACLTEAQRFGMNVLPHFCFAEYYFEGLSV
jgi:hypothetical protein